MLRCKYTINTRAKQRITSRELIVSVLHLSDVSGMARDRKSVFLFCVFRTCPVYLQDMSGITGIRTLIELQLSLWFIYFHISLSYSEACDLLNLSGLWASPKLTFKYGNLIRFMVKMKIGSPCLNRIKMFVESCSNYLKHLFRGS